MKSLNDWFRSDFCRRGYTFSLFGILSDINLCLLCVSLYLEGVIPSVL